MSYYSIFIETISNQTGVPLTMTQEGQSGSRVIAEGQNTLNPAVNLISISGGLAPVEFTASGSATPFLCIWQYGVPNSSTSDVYCEVGNPPRGPGSGDGIIIFSSGGEQGNPELGLQITSLTTNPSAGLVGYLQGEGETSPPANHHGRKHRHTPTAQ